MKNPPGGRKPSGGRVVYGARRGADYTRAAVMMLIW